MPGRPATLRATAILYSSKNFRPRLVLNARTAPSPAAEWQIYEGAEGWISQGVSFWPVFFATLFVGYLQWDVLWMLWNSYENTPSLECLFAGAKKQGSRAIPPHPFEDTPVPIVLADTTPPTNWRTTSFSSQSHTTSSGADTSRARSRGSR